MKIKVFKFTALFLAVNFLAQVLFPTIAFALTGGPSQPEVESFEPIGTSEMVDVFSGDFVYNIPLLNVGNYPINISYHSGVSMDQEASWVGLGWNINPGVINRNMRGLPDDFNGNGDNGDFITKKFNIKPNRTYGITGMISPEVVQFNFLSIGLGMGISYNNYKGFAMEPTQNIGISAAGGNKGQYTASLGLNVSTSSQDGMTIDPTVSFDARVRSNDERSEYLGAKVGASFNSRAGLTSLSLKSLNYKSYAYYSSQNLYETKSYDFMSKNGGSPISFVSPTYITPSNLPFKNTSVTLNLSYGATAFGTDFLLAFSGYYSEQKLRTNEKQYRSYGYLNSDQYNNVGSLLDFNREKDVAFTKNTPALPVTNFTYDIYSVSGQGIGGMYRPYRSDVGVVHDSYNNNGSDSYSLGVEFGGGWVASFGLDPRVVLSNTTTTKWRNTLSKKLSFQGKKDQPSNEYYEPYYFKQAGEKSVDSEFELEESFFNKVGGFNAVRPDLKSGGGFEVGTENHLKTADGNTISILDNVNRNKRQKRNETISVLTFKEARDFAIKKSLYSETDPNKAVYKGKDHHIAEMTSVNAQGMRYVYGIPAYNNLQREVSFSTGESPKRGQLAVDYSSGLVNYSTDGNADNSTSNERGIDNFYQMNETPAYAHSYLLTSVLSPDYVDNDKIPGPSATDMGTYTLFNYTKIPDYNWRVPVGSKKANSEEGLSSLTSDDHANYVYGTKEVWNLESIEDKNFIAKFITGEREDGLGVVDENGEINKSKKLKYLKEIRLYNISDQTTPIKTVHFVYDYSLCGNVPNNSGTGIDVNGKKDNESGYDATKNINAKKGKLTLKRIYFTYKNSKKAKFSPYEFTYHLTNPDYHLKMYDRWGNFKELEYLDGTSANPKYDYRDNANFPYTEQNATTAFKNAGAWNLTYITLPSGGSISVQYESDDYAYVQDKEAMQMFKIYGVSKEVKVSSTVEHLYDRSTNEDFNYIVLDVGFGIDTETFKKKYLRDIISGGKDLYFKFKVNLGSKNWNDLTYNQKTGSSDFVPGYVKIVDAVVKDGKAFLEMQLVPIGDRGEGIKISPIAKAALQFVRLYNPRLAYGLTDVNDGAVDQVLLSIINSSPTKNLFTIAKGINRFMMDNQQCREFIAKESFIRLYNPNGKKFGGGSRVSSIQVLDNSSQVIGANVEGGIYGQNYSYKTTDEEGNEISSGVASYEPLIGGDEIPHHKPVAYGTKQEKLLVPDDKFYLEEPFGECFFPGASVGYSKVTVTSINEASTKTGSVVHEFYTAKDFPTIVDRTDLQLLPKKSNIALRLLKIQQKDYMNASQGYVIELNDMHGKPKAQWVYGHDQKTYISGVEYKYKRAGNRLVNDATIILPDGRISNAKIGVDFDFVADMRQQESTTESFGINGNLAMFLAAIFPASIPLILPAYAKEETRFRSAVTTKVINRYGLLDEVIAYDLGSKVATQNIGYDGETGEVLVTKVQNNFDDPLYNFTFPAHWAHNRMGPAYQNIGVEYELELASGTAASTSNPFEIGDELIAIDNDDLDDPTKKDAVLEEMKYRFYVVEKTKTKVTIMGGKTTATNPSSTLLNGSTTFKIIRSGKRNMSNIPVGNVVCLKNPLKTEDSDQLKARIDFADFDHMVLSASASEFSDDWKIFCACDIDMGKYYNPVYYGAKAIWRPKKSYTFLTDRSKTSIEANLRKDGYFKAFNSFWKTPETGNTVWCHDKTNWTWTSEITSYDPYGGNEMENKDPLNRYANSGSGFNHQVPVTVSANAKYSDILFESFEDGDKKSCVEQKIKFTGGTIENKSHTGRSSIKIPKSSGGSSMTNLPVCK
ncbi:MAG: hypothetical protein J7604_18105 [Sporocytophaga sp.]|uniref:hypothetical protein n=1 Tax=Sporocytophaga sp. TaxID=2231183 RepID=UPI001AFE2D20|nr:hypothetical protein [Sporocytophaga sp.]MBO9702128.1 hypothetical protein [Sporocytophaga sp.]